MRLFVLLLAVLLFGCVQDSKQSAYPDWAYEARLAGFSFYPDFSDDDIEEKVSAAAEQNVSVMLVDTPMGWDYKAWEDDKQFDENKKLVQRVVQKARSKGLRVALYVTGLEVTGPAGVNPLNDHPDWLQADKNGNPVQFNDISSKEEHWLEKGEVDAWLSPEGQYRQFFKRRIEALAPLVDALWVDTVYLQVSIGLHDELWPSHDAASVQAFKAKYGFEPPREPDWKDEKWKNWLLWRQESINAFLMEVKQAAQKANPNVLVFAENWNVDSPLATGYAQDPAKVGRFTPTAPEVSTVADRTDFGEKAMGSATLGQWQAYAAMVAFSVHANRNAPTWVLTYGAKPEDSLKTAGVVLALGSQFYEAQGPSMLDHSVGEEFRKELFSWVAKEAQLLKKPRKARTALWYSSNARDFLDENKAGFYEEDTPFFNVYRQAAKALLEKHVPFHVVFDANGLTNYEVVVVPTACLSEEEREKLEKRTLAIVGAVYNEFCENRIVLKNQKNLDELTGPELPEEVFYSETNDAVFLANVGEMQSVELVAPSSAKKARFSAVGVEKSLNAENGKITTPEFSGPAVVEWR